MESGRVEEQPPIKEQLKEMLEKKEKEPRLLFGGTVEAEVFRGKLRLRKVK